ncbi:MULTISPECIES: HTH-type transcriptional regulator GlpR [Haloarcula]|uniref:DeoR family regulatory proteins n=1 Tax=Haloarcula pellucida TaxID=1427151 RepID=A0A830GLP1_9EURY|nr:MULTISPECIES: HTH-type transcriptional regulator GlpR [Halomicroarcula]MBX0349666.1 DeoR/GlpR family DNA-binding transcription regulator [Halomicroarcula pellucida]GGN95795.1 DeoR family regulatory proteins [Halomicroarcula pellucida]
MLPEKRKRLIVERVTEQDGCKAATLAAELDVSTATIRRDLRELEEEGRIERSHGGAVPATALASEQSFSQKEVQHLEQKRAIAERAVEEIRCGEVVFFDAGTTTMQIAKRIDPSDSFVAVTNSPLQAHTLGENDFRVKLTGGTLREETRACVGPSAERFVDRTKFDLLFLGTNGIDPEAGLLTPNEDEAEVKSRIVEAASRVVLVADSSKVNQQSFVRFARLEDVDLFVTDRLDDAAVYGAFDDAATTVVEVSR